MLEPLIEAGGCIVGLALLLYFQVLRPSREQARAHSRTRNPAADDPKATDGRPSE